MAEGYHDFTAGEVLTAANLEDYCELQTIMRFASEAARNTALSGVLTEGLTTYQKDANQFTVYDGSAWQDFGRLSSVDTWTPGVLQSPSMVSSTVTLAEYILIGNVCFAWFNLAITGGGTAGAAVTVSLPVSRVAGNTRPVGAGYVIDASVGSVDAGVWDATSTTTVSMAVGEATSANYWGVTPNIALASGDTLVGQLVYRTA